MRKYFKPVEIRSINYSNPRLRICCFKRIQDLHAGLLASKLPLTFWWNLIFLDNHTISTVALFWLSPWNENYAWLKLNLHLCLLINPAALLCCSCLSVWVPFFWLGNSSWWIGSHRRFGGNPRAQATWPEGVCDDNGNRRWCDGATSDVGKTHRGNERDMGREDGENWNHPQRKVPIRNLHRHWWTGTCCDSIVYS